MSQKGQRTLRAGKLLAAAVATAGMASSARAALMTYDMRALPTTGTTSVKNNYNNQTKAVPVTIGQVVTMDMWAVISMGTDGDQATDGLHVTEGSFRSFVNTLKVDAGPANAITPWDGVFQAGAVQDVDADGDKDLGDITYTGNPTGAPNASAWFGASNGTNPARGFSTQDNGLDTAYTRISRMTFTVTGGSGSTSVNFVPRLVSTSTSQDLRTKYLVDDIYYQVDANGNGTASCYFNTSQGASCGSLGTTTVNVTGALGIGNPVALNAPVPEPATLGLIGIGAAALLRRRQRKA